MLTKILALVVIDPGLRNRAIAGSLIILPATFQSRFALRIVANRIIVSPDGEIFDHELHPPSEYLTSLVAEIESADQSPDGRGSEQVLLGP